ncbi:hypothetical protein P1X14_03375 [Sphingomonas sp. AOB5]|uniref:hypothetical protein n=1 Tax=Sphingomonas sp. AOB5 TaxID=3034017 RepID=UPI0023F7CDE4|nr:hypothetical protein [Sphingomonas sp. AOB5]MDF7774279.1 hypothetical protein [Sphingomonas sp. AOB5]
MWNVAVYLMLLVATCLYAGSRGGAPERIATAIILGAVALTYVAAKQWRWAFTSRETGILAVDIVMLVAVVLLAMRADRYWPIWMAAFLGLGIELQFVMWAAPERHVEIYRVLHFWNAYPTLLLLAIGTWRHRTRLAQNGADPSWSNFSRLPAAAQPAS